MTIKDQQEPWRPSQVAARIAAAKGDEHLGRLQATLDLARAMLASGEVSTSPEGQDRIIPSPYPWELSEPEPDLPRQVWYGSLENLASGEGHTVYFGVGLHRSEDEFRRELALAVGRPLANAATISLRADALPLAAVFLTDRLKANFEHMRKYAPNILTFLIEYHANYS